MTAKKGSFKYSLIILLASVFWGTAFVAQRMGMDDMTPMFFNSFRMLFGGTILVPIFLISQRIYDKHAAQSGKAPTRDEKRLRKKDMVIGGIICGILLFGASSLQQMGLVTISAGKSGFLTAMYIILVPVLGLFLRHKTPLLSWVSVAMAVVGLYFLCMTEDFTLAIGDLYTLICAVFFAIHILVTNHYAPKVNVIGLVCIQSLVCSLISFIVAICTETFILDSFIAALPAVLYAGILSGGIAYTLQALGQKGANPTVAALMMSMESLFAVVGGFIVLHEVFTGREAIGCVFMFAAMIVTQLPSLMSSKSSQEEKKE